MSRIKKIMKTMTGLIGGIAVLLNGFSVLASEQEESSASVFSQPQTTMTGHHKVALDPGHQGYWVDMSAQEPDGPGSYTTKMRCTSGTVGSYTGLYEYELNLMISLKVRNMLEAKGYQVFMTREDNDANISNAERAQAASASGAEIYVRIHANGDESHTQSGALTLYPSESNPYVSYLSADSLLLANSILTDYCAVTGFANLGNMPSDNMTGINWSTIPVMILEMGFMTHPTDDERMADENFQNTMALGIVNGIDDYFAAKYPDEVTSDEPNDTASDAAGVPDAEPFSDDKPLNDLKKLLSSQIPALIDQNGSWAFYIEALSNKAAFTIKTSSEPQMQAASLIKLFIMGAIYENYDAYAASYGSDYIDGNLQQMITISDNDSANNLVNVLGNGDSTAGMTAVNNFCQAHGFENTHMGRLLLAPNDVDDNYTSVSDCGHFLESMMTNDGRLTHTSEMLGLLCAQERRHKIPAGLPADGSCICGNKTGELSNVENDAAVIFNAPKTDYIFVVMSENLTDSGSAQQSISQISSIIYNYFES